MSFLLFCNLFLTRSLLYNTTKIVTRSIKTCPFRLACNVARVLRRTAHRPDVYTLDSFWCGTWAFVVLVLSQGRRIRSWAPCPKATPTPMWTGDATRRRERSRTRSYRDSESGIDVRTGGRTEAHSWHPGTETAADALLALLRITMHMHCFHNSKNQSVFC